MGACARPGPKGVPEWSPLAPLPLVLEDAGQRAWRRPPNPPSCSFLSQSELPSACAGRCPSPPSPLPPMRGPRSSTYGVLCECRTLGRAERAG